MPGEEIIFLPDDKAALIAVRHGKSIASAKVIIFREFRMRKKHMISWRLL